MLHLKDGPTQMYFYTSFVLMTWLTVRESVTATTTTTTTPLSLCGLFKGATRINQHIFSLLVLLNNAQNVANLGHSILLKYEMPDINGKQEFVVMVCQNKAAESTHFK